MKKGPEKKKIIVFSGTGKHSDRAVKKWAHSENKAEAAAGRDLKQLGFLLCSWAAIEACCSDQSTAQGHFQGCPPCNILTGTDKLETGRASLEVEVGTEIAHLIGDADH